MKKNQKNRKITALPKGGKHGKNGFGENVKRNGEEMTAKDKDEEGIEKFLWEECRYRGARKKVFIDTFSYLSK